LLPTGPSACSGLALPAPAEETKRTESCGEERDRGITTNKKAKTLPQFKKIVSL